jgi:hypothetical protein
LSVPHPSAFTGADDAVLADVLGAAVPVAAAADEGDGAALVVNALGGGTTTAVLESD